MSDKGQRHPPTYNLITQTSPVGELPSRPSQDDQDQAYEHDDLTLIHQNGVTKLEAWDKDRNWPYYPRLQPPPKHWKLNTGGRAQININCYCSTPIWGLFEIVLVLLMSLGPLVAMWNCVFSALCCCKRGGFSFILCEQNFGTAVLSQLILQHARLTIVRDSPCIADVARATGRVVGLSIQRVMPLQKGRIIIYFTWAKLWHRGSQSINIAACSFDDCSR